MSGIAGIFNLDGRPVDLTILESMSSALAHRGPDGSGIWRDGPVGLAHRVLHSTPESLRETQPLRDESARLVLVLDGRIDNREELKAAIEGAGGRLRDDTDAELVLKAYECWQEACPGRIQGDFAFAIWDARRRRLFCARDPLGNKLFFYRCDSESFAFSSEMQPLFADRAFYKQLNLPMLGMYLSCAYGKLEETLYQGVFRLPAAHAMCVETTRQDKIRYWDVDPGRVIRYRTDEEYSEHFLSLFRNSVRCNLRAQGGVAAELSGGLDSSSLVCTAAKLHKEGAVPGGRLMTVSAVFPGLACDESDYIQAVVNQCDVEPYVIQYHDVRSCLHLDQASRFPDVFYDPTLLLVIPALQEMQRRKIRVLIQGLGGDELMATGFGHLTDLTLQGRWPTLLRQLRADAAGYEIAPSSLFLNYCARPLVPGAVKSALRPLIRLLRGDGLPLLQPRFRKKHRLAERIRNGFPVTRFATRAQQEVYDGLFYHWNRLAAEMCELFSARFGVECRWPFLERRVVEFMLAVPEDQRWRIDQPKFVLRQAMEGLLPEKIRRRKDKAGFDVITDRELKGRQAERTDELFQTSQLVALGIGDPWQLQKMLKQYRSGQSRLAMMVLLVVQLEMFCRLAEASATPD